MKLSLCLCLAVLAAGLWLVVDRAERTPTHCKDEPLWFLRSQAPPWDLSADAAQFWSIDCMGANRLVYWAALRATGLWRVPAGEKPGWQVDRRARLIKWRGWRAPQEWLKDFNAWTSDTYGAYHGVYAPRRAILLMRHVNIAAYGLTLVCLWGVAFLALRSPLWATVAASPLLLMPAVANGTVFLSWSGDVFMAAAAALTLLAWTWAHLRGMALRRVWVLVIGFAAGLVTAAKQPGVLVVFAVVVYYAWKSRGWARVWNPLAAGAVAFVAFAAVNPVVFLCPGENPVNILIEMCVRRTEVMKMIAANRGALELSEVARQAFPWWWLLPGLLAAAWQARRAPWFVPVALWSGCLIIGTAWGLISAKAFEPRYLAPLEWALGMPVTLATIWSCGRGRALSAEDALRVARGGQTLSGALRASSSGRGS